MSQDSNQRQLYGSPPYGQQLYGRGEMRYVGVDPRFLALLIDTILIGLIVYLASVLFPDAPGLPGTLIVVFIPGYQIVMEATQGATLGKMALGLRVVKTDGSPTGWSEAVIRNLLRIIDGLFVGLVGVVLISNSPLKQRFGDRVAHTVVIRRRI